LLTYSIDKNIREMEALFQGLPTHVFIIRGDQWDFMGLVPVYGVAVFRMEPLL
jgi:hypothetical protein